MNVGELYTFLKNAVDNNEIDLDAPVIYVGEYNYGADLRSVCISTMSNIEDEVICENRKVLAFGVDTYVYESEDIGFSNMWVDDDTLKEFKAEISED